MHRFLAPAFLAVLLSAAGAWAAPLKVVGRFLQDAHGHNLMLRGMNVPVYKSGFEDDLDAVAAAVATTRANVVRFEWWAVPQPGTTEYTVANLDRAIQKYFDLGIITIVDLHDLTFQFGHDEQVGPNSDGNDQTIFASTITAYWTRPDVLAVLVKHQDHIVINVANEWGSSLYHDGTPTTTNFIQNYTTAITALRNAGIIAPLMIDAPKGFEYQFLLDHGAALLALDPKHNTMLSTHAYWAATAFTDAQLGRHRRRDHGEQPSDRFRRSVEQRLHGHSLRPDPLSASAHARQRELDRLRVLGVVRGRPVRPAHEHHGGPGRRHGADRRQPGLRQRRAARRQFRHRYGHASHDKGRFLAAYGHGHSARGCDLHAHGCVDGRTTWRSAASSSGARRPRRWWCAGADRRSRALGWPACWPIPTLTLVRSSDQTVIATNDDWQDAANAADIVAAGFAPGDAHESAVMMTLDPGVHRDRERGGRHDGCCDRGDLRGRPSGGADRRASRRVGEVDAGDNVLIGGIIVQGAAPQTVVIRARGPSLAGAGWPGCWPIPC